MLKETFSYRKIFVYFQRIKTQKGDTVTGEQTVVVIISNLNDVRIALAFSDITQSKPQLRNPSRTYNGCKDTKKSRNSQIVSGLISFLYNFNRQTPENP